MTYEEIIERIHELSRFGSRLGLERMEELMKRLGNPQDDMKIIHVAGTNGKGSVCRYLYSILKENGYRVGLYTSPFLERFTERIEFDGREISEKELIRYGVEVFEKVDEMTAEGLDSPTEFEVVTAIGFCYFKRQNIDFLVLEVGLGGRGDSTNIVKNPIAAAITSISFDHMEYLGNTLADIAREKAGIIKEAVPVISNVKDGDAAAEIKKIAEYKGSPCFEYPLYTIADVSKSLDSYGFDLIGENGRICFSKAEISMIGIHQIENAACALKVIEVIEKLGYMKTEEAKVRKGLREAKQAGRLEVIGREPLIIIDGAHNEGGAESLLNVMSELFSGKRILMVIGVLAGKELSAILGKFVKFSKDFIATEPAHPGKLGAEILCGEILNCACSCTAEASPQKALQLALDRAHEFDLILVAGSIYLIGKIRSEVLHEI